MATKETCAHCSSCKKITKPDETHVVVNDQIKLSRQDLIDLAYEECLAEQQKENDRLGAELNDLKTEIETLVRERVKVAYLGIKIERLVAYPDVVRISGTMTNTALSNDRVMIDIQFTFDEKRDAYLELVRLQREGHDKLHQMISCKKRFTSQVIKKMIADAEGGRAVLDQISALARALVK